MNVSEKIYNAFYKYLFHPLPHARNIIELDCLDYNIYTIIHEDNIRNLNIIKEQYE